MAELVEENDDRQNEQKGNDVTNQTMAYRIDSMSKNSAIAHPSASHLARPNKQLGCLCGNFRQEGLR